MTATDTTRWAVPCGPAALNVISSVAVASTDNMAASRYRVIDRQPRVAK
jgi:hypothetical protein